jgi:SAM-dependent methyltransferase
MTSLDQLHQLQSPQGTTLFAELWEQNPQPGTGLAIIARLRKRFPPDMVAAAMTIHLLRTRATEKFSRAEEMWFTRDGYEQATAEPIASYRAARFACCQQVFDLCCGIGGDLIGLATQPSIANVVAVDLDPVHLAMAELNARVYHATAHIESRLEKVERTDLTGADGVFIDPARRDNTGRKKLGQSDPDLSWCLRLADRVPNTGIKFAPGLSHQLLPDDWGLETIALGSDLKEAMLWSPALRHHPRQATVIEGDTVSTFAPVPGDQVAVREPVAGDFLYDPNPAITRAGLVDDLARALDAAKIDDQIAFLITRERQESRFARGFPVLASMPWHERNLKQMVIDLDGGEVTLRRRGLAGNVDDIQRRLRGKGNQRLFIAMTRLRDRPWAIICATPT